MLLAQVQRLTASHNALAKACEQNTEAFSKGLVFADAMIWILRAALNDVLGGGVLSITVGTKKQIDIAGYLKRYEEQLGTDPTVPPFPTSILDEPIIFGGHS